MKTYIYLLPFLLLFGFCQSQTKKAESGKHIGGPCEGCEAIYEYGDRKLKAVDTLPAYRENEPKIKITGTVYKKDGKTPARDVILYIYHTNRKGIYETRKSSKNWERRHGFIRGWIKTDKDGRYTFYTFRPGAYPNRQAAEHIHITVKEPDKNEYYIDSYMFTDDPLLTEPMKRSSPGRGGQGIVTPQYRNGMLLVQRDIILGLNIPGYD